MFFVPYGDLGCISILTETPRDSVFLKYDFKDSMFQVQLKPRQYLLKAFYKTVNCQI